LPLETPFEDKMGVHVYHQYTILSDHRETILTALQAQQIACAVYYPVPLHQQAVFLDSCQGLSLPVTESVAARCLSLPICPSLSDSQIREISAIISDTLS